MSITIFILLGVAILALVIWLLFPAKANGSSSVIESLEIEQLQPLHCRHFPQIRLLLEPDDRKFVERSVSATAARIWRRERRKILLAYVRGLAEDFNRLERLARLLASLSPEVTRKREWEWFWRGLQFRIMLRLLTARFAFGDFSLPHLARLTDFVASHAAELEVRMSQMSGMLPSRVRMSAGT